MDAVHMGVDHALLLEHFFNFAIATALGLLVGSERGWHVRGGREGSRVAGIRTFTLIAMLGALVSAGVSTLPMFERWLLCGVVFVPVSLLLIAGFFQFSRANDNVSITSEMAAMLVYWIGVMPSFNLALPAAAAAVMVALLLHLKDTLHALLITLDRSEVLGTLQFLLTSVVLLPLLPNKGFGPWQAINPYQLWWMVVLISGLSLLGYFSVRLTGPRKGILVTSISGGLVSSTAVTLSLSRLHGGIYQTPIIAAGILLASATMFARILLIVAVLNPGLVVSVLASMGVGMVALLVAAGYQWRQVGGDIEGSQPEVRNPLQLVPALQFAALLAVVMLAADLLQHWFGNTGLLLLSMLTGLVEVIAIVLSLSPKAGSQLSVEMVVACIALAAATNTVMKGVYCRVIGGAQLGWRVLLPSIASSLAVMAVGLWPMLM